MSPLMNGFATVRFLTFAFSLSRETFVSPVFLKILVLVLSVTSFFLIGLEL